MRRVTGVAAFLVSLLLPLTLAVIPAQAATHFWYGKVKHVQDGDTVYVDIKGDGTHKGVPIRNLGIQATETQPSLECHAAAARSHFRSILKKGDKVRLAADHANSTAGKDPKGRMRYWRYVDKWSTSTHKWVDVQAWLLRNGDVMWLDHAKESARTSAYHRYMQEGVATHRGLWDTDYCGTGPEQSATLRMWLNYDANGSDGEVVNGEWMRIQNRGATDVSLAGWKLRNASHKFHGGTYYTIPAGAVVPAGQTITVYFGSGTTNPSAGRFYLGIAKHPYLGNVTNPKLGLPGKTIYLLDPQYDFRAMADYPCMVNCAALPAVEISAVRSTGSDESVSLKLKPSATSGVDLTAVVLVASGWTKEIAPGTVLQPGETLTVWCDRTAPDTRLVQNWGPATTKLRDSGGSVVLRTAESQVIDTFSW